MKRLTGDSDDGVLVIPKTRSSNEASRLCFMCFFVLSGVGFVDCASGLRSPTAFVELAVLTSVVVGWVGAACDAMVCFPIVFVGMECRSRLSLTVCVVIFFSSHFDSSAFSLIGLAPAVVSSLELSRLPLLVLGSFISSGWKVSDFTLALFGSIRLSSLFPTSDLSSGLATSDLPTVVVVSFVLSSTFSTLFFLFSRIA